MLHPHDNTAPTVVLVHGAFADQSYWWATAAELRSLGISVLVPPNPLSGLAADAEYVARAVRRARGPVLLVGHSYGGAVISVAAAAAGNVVGLVYLAGYILEEGETFGDVLTESPRAGRRGGERGGAGLHLAQPPDPASSPAADLPDAGPRTQPVAASIFAERASGAAWKQVRSWAIVATADRALPAEAQRHMARRAGAETVEVAASHTLAVSHPGAVVELIVSALGSSSADRVAA